MVRVLTSEVSFILKVPQHNLVSEASVNFSELLETI